MGLFGSKFLLFDSISCLVRGDFFLSSRGTEFILQCFLLFMGTTLIFVLGHEWQSFVEIIFFSDIIPTYDSFPLGNDLFLILHNISFHFCEIMLASSSSYIC